MTARPGQRSVKAKRESRRRAAKQIKLGYEQLAETFIARGMPRLAKVCKSAAKDWSEGA